MRSAETSQIEGDFTTQMLYCAIKTGVHIDMADMGLNVFYDLIDYSAQIDALTIAKAEGKNIQYTKPMSLSDMTLNGKLRG